MPSVMRPVIRPECRVPPRLVNKNPANDTFPTPGFEPIPADVPGTIFDRINVMDREIDNECGKAQFGLAELVRDPLIGLVMESDGVDRRCIELLFERIARARPIAIRRPDGASRARALSVSSNGLRRAAKIGLSSLTPTACI